MTFPKARLVVSLLLFLSWLGFLFYLVLERRTSLISRPQFQIAQAVLVVSVRDDAGKPDAIAVVKEVLWGDLELAGEKLRLADLLGCTKDHGYAGPGDYVIPLMRRGGVWQIAPIPTPGYKRPHPSHGALEIQSAGADPECVLACLLEFAKENPGEADELLRPIMPQIAAFYLGRALLPLPVPAPAGGMPIGPLPPRRLPIGAALDLKKKLEWCRAKVAVEPEEVRIYRWTPEVREQVDEVIAVKPAWLPPAVAGPRGP